MYNTHCLLGFLHILAIVGCVKKEKVKKNFFSKKMEKKEKQTVQGMGGVGVAQKNREAHIQGGSCSQYEHGDVYQYFVIIKSSQSDLLRFRYENIFLSTLLPWELG